MLHRFRVTGSLAAPKMEGAASITGATLFDPDTGTRLTGVTGSVRFEGDRARIERLSAATPGNGTLSITGAVTLKGDIPTYSVEEGRKVVQYKRTALLKTFLPVLEQAGQIFPRVDPSPAEFHQPGMIVDARTAFPSLPAREVFRSPDEEEVAAADVLVAACLVTR